MTLPADLVFFSRCGDTSFVLKRCFESKEWLVKWGGIFWQRLIGKNTAVGVDWLNVTQYSCFLISAINCFMIVGIFLETGFWGSKCLRDLECGLERD